MNDDVMLDKSGDIVVGESGDIFLTDSVIQAVTIRLRWIQNEWRLGPELGFPYFEDVFVKNPNTSVIAEMIRNEAMEVEGVDDVIITDIIHDKKERTVKFDIEVYVGDEIYEQEVVLNG